MPRDLTTFFKDAIKAGVVYPATLVEMDFPSGFVRLWDGLGALAWDAKAWEGIGSLGSIGAITDTGATQASGLALSLSGVPSANINLALVEAYRGRSVRLWIALFTAAGVLIVDPSMEFGGRMDTMIIVDGGETSVITVQCESHLVDLKRANSLRYSNAEQQRMFPGDLGLESIARMAEKPIPWGNPGTGQTAPSYPSYPGGGGDSPPGFGGNPID